MKTTKILGAIFLCSFASLAFEVALTRIFSISLWYHFAFMIISIAMLGIGASGTVLALAPGLKSLPRMGTYALLLGFSISSSYLLANQIPFDPVKLSWSEGQLFYVGLYYVILATPFFLTGLIIATAFSSMSGRSGLLYGADLLGAGMGSVGILLLMAFAAPDRAVFLISCIALIAALSVGGRVVKIAAFILILLNLLILILRPEFAALRMSPYKGLQMALRYPGAKLLGTFNTPFSRTDLFTSPAVRFAPGLSLRYLDPLPEQIGLSVDGGDVNAVTSLNEKERMAFLKYLPSALPHEIKQREDALILDPKGGLQVLLAGHYGSKAIYKVESTPFLPGIIENELGSFSGNIYSQNAWSGLGRSWLKSTKRKFDLIDLSLMGAIPSGSFGISEDYQYTVEAFREYLEHLKPGGVLSINLFILPPPRIELRLLMTAIRALEEAGIRNVRDHIASIRSWGSICIALKKSPFTPGEISAIKSFSRDRRFDLICYPGVKEEETNLYVRTAANEYFTAFEQLLNPDTRRWFADVYLFDVNPVRDENPFFHYYLRFSNIREIYRTMGEKWQYFIEEGYLLPAVFLQVVLLSVLIIVLPVMAGKRKNATGVETGRGRGHRMRSLSFFALIGLGFMFVEISLIQKMILPLESPSYAVAIVLTSILVSSGIGSLASSRMKLLVSPSVTIILSFIIFVYSLALPGLWGLLSFLTISVKAVVVFAMLLPMGFFMGIPFPAALKTLGEQSPSLIPWAWAVNGCFSVLAPLASVMIAMSAGFKVVLWTGAGCYLLSYLALRRG